MTAPADVKELMETMAISRDPEVNRRFYLENVAHCLETLAAHPNVVRAEDAASHISNMIRLSIVFS